MGAFIGGLRAELASEVRINRPKTYSEAIEIARLRDDHLVNLRKSARPEPRKGIAGPLEFRTGGMTTNGTNSGIGNRILPLGVKKIPWDEMQKRREKGLCFNCDEKFIPGHKCKTRQSFLIDAGDSEEEDATDKEDGQNESHTEISVHAIAGTRGPRTLKFTANIKNRQVVVLVDNESSHNFINQTLARKLHLVATPVDVFQVRIANGDKITCNEQYREVPICMQGVTIKTDLFALPLVGPDIVLGVQWLEGLGRIVSDYGKGTMEFQWGDGTITLTSQENDLPKEASFRAIERMHRRGA